MLTRRIALTQLTTIALAALTSGLWVRPTGSPRAVERDPSEIVVHKGWVLRRTDLREDVSIIPVASDAV